MPSTLPWRTRHSLWAIAAFLPLLALGLGTRQTRLAQPYGHFTLRQIVDRTRPLSRLLRSPAQRLQFTATPMEGPPPGSWAARCWMLDCSDENGHEVAHFAWDADTGALQMYSNSEPLPYIDDKVPMDHRQAVVCAGTWMRFLEQAARNPPGKYLRTLNRRGRSWWMVWQVGLQNAIVAVDAYTVVLICYNRV